jgi:N6-L-threonylcarbamoyladenine synthase
MKDHGKLKWIGGTRDDAAGEAFDKSARLLGLPYPGGPAISQQADKHLHRQLMADSRQLNMFPRPMINKDNFDWSFSGLKTALLTKTKELKDKRTEELAKTQVSLLAAEVQEAIVDVLVNKTLKATKKYKPKSLLLAGGVAANTRLREKFKLEIEKRDSFGVWKLKTDFFVPPPSLCTDNASYIASFAHYNYHPIPWKKIAANPQLTITGEK